MQLIGRLLMGIALVGSVTAGTAAAQWPQFRGPTGDGHVTAGSLPVRWDETSGVTWKSTVPGRGHSSPVVAGGLVWLTTAIEQEPSLRALAFDQTDGSLVHDIELFRPEELEPIHHTNTYASPTPVLDEGKVYVHFGSYGSACIAAETGDVVWRNADIKVDHQNGPGSSPVLVDGLLITHYDGIDQQFIAALKAADGSLAWRTERSGELNDKPDMKKAYCTPAVIETARGLELISPAADWVYGYDPASGEELWKIAYGELGFSTVPKPVVGDDFAYICTSFTRSRLLAIRYDGQGDVTSSHVAWTSDSLIPKKPSLLLIDDLLVVGNDAGIITCLDARSGREIWRERIGGNFSASPLYADGRIYFFSEAGITTVIAAAEQFELLATNELGDGFTASPAAADNALFLRSQSALYRIDAEN